MQTKKRNYSSLRNADKINYKTQYVKCEKVELLNDLKKSLMKKAIDYLMPTT